MWTVYLPIWLRALDGGKTRLKITIKIRMECMLKLIMIETFVFYLVDDWCWYGD